MKGKLICSAGSRLKLQEMINKWYISENWIIIDTESGYKAYNVVTGKYSDCIVKNQRGRWRFELAGG